MRELVSIGRAICMTRKHVPQLRGQHDVPLLSAAGRVLACDIISHENMPDHDRATMDGYAVRACDTRGASEDSPRYLMVGAEVAMGTFATRPLGEREAAPCGTGALLPPGADAVLMVEYTRVTGDGQVEVFRDVSPGENTLARGEDLGAGDVILTDGMYIRPQEIGVLSALGYQSVPVYRRPGVAIISTGDELVDPGHKPGPGQFRDVNGPALLAAVAIDGGEPIPGGIIPDQEADLRQVLRDLVARDDVDLILLSGGSSVGTRDLSARVVDQLGGPGIIVHGVAVKPGKPTLIAAVNGTPIFGLPGHPVSCLVTYHVLVRPVLANLCGLKDPGLPRPHLVCPLLDQVRSDPGRDEYVRVVLERGADGDVTARPLPRKSAVFSSMVRSHGYIIIPAGAAGAEDGSMVRVYAWPWSAPGGI